MKEAVPFNPFQTDYSTFVFMDPNIEALVEKIITTAVNKECLFSSIILMTSHTKCKTYQRTD
jgi:hypothetical protein